MLPTKPAQTEQPAANPPTNLQEFLAANADKLAELEAAPNGTSFSWSPAWVGGPIIFAQNQRGIMHFTITQRPGGGF